MKNIQDFGTLFRRTVVDRRAKFSFEEERLIWMNKRESVYNMWELLVGHCNYCSLSVKQKKNEIVVLKREVRNLKAKIKRRDKFINGIN